jgi:hypothetical protein
MQNTFFGVTYNTPKCVVSLRCFAKVPSSAPKGLSKPRPKPIASHPHHLLLPPSQLTAGNSRDHFLSGRTVTLGLSHVRKDRLTSRALHLARALGFFLTQLRSPFGSEKWEEAPGCSLQCHHNFLGVIVLLSLDLMT